MPASIDHAWLQLIHNISPCSKEHKLSVIRSVLNGWVTSYRYHEAVLLPCVFGCKLLHPIHDSGYKDELAHYLRCPQLWKLIADVLQADIPTSAAMKLCLDPGSNPSFIIMAHQIYHFIKLGNRARVLCMCSIQHVNELRELAFRFGTALRSDMRI